MKVEFKKRSVSFRAFSKELSIY